MKKVFAALAVGILAAPWLPVLPSFSSMACLAAGGLCSTLLGWQRFPLLLLVGVCLLGSSYGLWRGYWRYCHWVDESLTGHTLQVTGEVVTVSTRGDSKRTRLLFDAQLPNKKLGRLSLGWYDAPPVQEGERWSLSVRLKRPWNFAAIGVRDYQGWLLRHNVVATGYIRTGVKVQERLPAPIFSATQVHYAARDWLQNHLKGPGEALVRALVVGDSSGLDADMWKVFVQTGTVHLLVISGLHIGLVATTGFWLMWVLGWLGLLPVRYRWPARWGALAGWLVALSYALLAGFSLPVQRAFIMLSLATLALLCGFRLSYSATWLAALVAVVLLDPFAGSSMGFWLSFGAVGALLYVFSSPSKRGAVATLVVAQCATGIALAPILAFFQLPVHPLSALINLLSIPLIACVMIPVLLVSAFVAFCLPTSGLWLLQMAGHGLDAWYRALQWLLGATGEGYLLPVPSVGSLLLAAIGTVLLLSPKLLGWRLSGVVCLLPWLWPIQDKPQWGTAHVTVLDVGQGLAIVVRTHSRTLLYDTGDRFSAQFSAASAVILPWLHSHHIRRLDRIVISHSDRDHVGGLQAISARWPKADLLMATPEDYADAGPCEGGTSWKWDGVTFTFLKGSAGRGSRNDRSCVLAISTEAGQHQALLTGDISSKREKQLLAQYGEKLHSEVLQVPHHGSRSSSSQAFVQQVAPLYASVSAGYSNRFGHPSADTLDRLHKSGADVLVSAVTGTQTFFLGTERKPQCERSVAPAWWQRLSTDGRVLDNCQLPGQPLIGK